MENTKGSHFWRCTIWEIDWMSNNDSNCKTLGSKSKIFNWKLKNSLRRSGYSMNSTKVFSKEIYECPFALLKKRKIALLNISIICSSLFLSVTKKPLKLELSIIGIYPILWRLSGWICLLKQTLNNGWINYSSFRLKIHKIICRGFFLNLSRFLTWTSWKLKLFSIWKSFRTILEQNQFSWNCTENTA